MGGWPVKRQRSSAGQPAPVGQRALPRVVIRTDKWTYTALTKSPVGVSIVRAYISERTYRDHTIDYILTVRIPHGDAELVHDLGFERKEEAVAALGREMGIPPNTVH